MNTKQCDCLDECGSDPDVVSGKIPPCANLVAERLARPDNNAVSDLADAMRAKLAKQRAKGYGGWNTPECTQQRLSDMLRDHVDKGDPVDVANFCAFLASRGESIAPAEVQAEPTDAEIIALNDGERYFSMSESRFGKKVNPHTQYHTGEPGYIEFARAVLNRWGTAPQAQPADALTEPLTRYCPGCGSVGPVDSQYRDCCPDGNQARMIPEALAEKCHDTFKVAITSTLDVQTALRDYHYALDTRQHGGVASDKAIKAIELAFDMSWIQGQEAAARAATAAQAAWPQPGDLVRYNDGITALALHGDPHAGGWHGTQCMGGYTFYSRTYKPSEADRQTWVECAIKYRGKTLEEAQREAGVIATAAAQEGGAA